jgi:hypothetical protein
VLAQRGAGGGPEQRVELHLEGEQLHAAVVPEPAGEHGDAGLAAGGKGIRALQPMGASPGALSAA